LTEASAAVHQLLRAGTGKHGPRILQAAPTFHARSGHGGYRCSAWAEDR